MIRITMKRYDRTVELKLPTEYEHVLVSLWKLGLDRDPLKYTLRELNAVISYDTPDEHQMTRIITIRNTLMDALVLLHRMMAPPFPIAARVRSRVLEGSYRSGIALLTDIDELVENEAMYEVEMYFPVSGELVDAKGNIEKAPPEIMIEYPFRCPVAGSSCCLRRRNQSDAAHGCGRNRLRHRFCQRGSVIRTGPF